MNTYILLEITAQKRALGITFIQELPAPSSVKFLTKQGLRLGHTTSLEHRSTRPEAK